MPATTQPRRTQAERREATTAKLLGATIECLAELGYARTSVAAICSTAGLSQGALFRHFATRRDVIVAAADAISTRHLEHFEAAVAQLDPDDHQSIVRVIRGICRTPTHAAWHEIMVASRTDAELRDAARDGLQRFETMLIEASARFFGVGREAAERVAVVLLSVMHLFDSEAVTVVVLENERLEQARIDWIAGMLQRELGGMV